MGTFGWVLVTGGFLILIMVANNSWPWVWAKISRGMPQPGEGNRIVPNPPESEVGTNPPDFSNLPSSGGTGEGNVIVPNPPEGQAPTEPTIFPWTVPSAPAGSTFRP